MAGLYIASTQARAGKTLFVCSLGLLLQKRGHKVGYMKPLGASLRRVEAGNGDADALTVQEFLGQNELPETLTPVMMPPSWSSLVVTEGADFASRTMQSVKSSYQSIAAKNDLTFVSATGAFPYAGSFAGIDSLSLIKELDLQVLFVERYENGINYDGLLFSRQLLGERMLGVILNDLPEDELPLCHEMLVPYLERNGVSVMGVMPHEPLLNSIRCIDLAYALGGRIVAGNSNANRQVAEFIIGTMQVENFMGRLRHSTRKAVIVGGDRADLQLASIHCGCPCIIITGNMGPSDLVRTKAEEHGTPIIAVQEDTYAVARQMSRILKGQKFHDLAQVYKGMEMVEQSIERDKLMQHPLFAALRSQI